MLLCGRFSVESICNEVRAFTGIAEAGGPPAPF
jgi:hypothetical protein